MGQRVNYRAWVMYIFDRLEGFEFPTKGTADHRRR